MVKFKYTCIICRAYHLGQTVVLTNADDVDHMKPMGNPSFQRSFPIVKQQRGRRPLTAVV